jgi:cytochrome c biogenesis protein CcdA
MFILITKVITKEKLNMNQHTISITTVISLAIVDAINPCALAVLTMMLLAIITYNPQKKTNIILGGLAFTTSVFIMYMIYGVFIIKSFQLMQAIASVRVFLYPVLGILAILLGAMQMKDFFFYKQGTFTSEMPVSWRSKVKSIIEGVTSPKGAFLVGAFVTVFLLPCTIGPYVILGGMLSFMEIVETLPFLMLYNAIFVLPMLCITIVIYIGAQQIEDISQWKDKYIRYIHMVSGIIILLLGILMLIGWEGV